MTRLELLRLQLDTFGSIHLSARDGMEAQALLMCIEALARYIKTHDDVRVRDGHLRSAEEFLEVLLLPAGKLS